MNSKWQSGYYPFPEMTRFLNSYSRIHYQSDRKLSSNSRGNNSLLEYVCRWEILIFLYKFICSFSSIANNREHIEEILIIFGEDYRSLIRTIIQHDCIKMKRNSWPTINIERQKYILENKRIEWLIFLWWWLSDNIIIK